MGRIEKYRVLAIADVHMSNRLPYAKPVDESGVTDRFLEQLELWKQVKETVDKERPDVVWILGDLFDKSNVDPITLKYTVRAIMSLDCPVEILPGNHDASMATGGSYIVEAFSEMGRNDVVCLDMKDEGDWVRPWLRVFSVPFCPAEVATSKIRGFQDQIASDTSKHTNVLLLHHSILGCRHLGWTCDQGLDAELITEGFDLVLSGHFHDAQSFGPGPGVVGAYLGSPMHHTFADASRTTEPNYWVFDFVCDFTDSGKRLLRIDTRKFLAKMPRFYHTIIDEEATPRAVSGTPLALIVDKGDFWRLEVRATKERWAETKAAHQHQIDALKKRGVRASLRHRPVVKGKARIKVESTPGSVGESVESYLRRYVVAVVGKEKREDRKALIKAGVEILEEARNAD